MPWIVRKTPTVLGHVEATGGSVADAEVYVIEGWKKEPCHPSKEFARSTVNGSFRIEGTRGLGAIGYGDYVAGFTVCIRKDNRWYFGYYEGGMAYSPPAQLTLRCDISAASPEGTPLCRR